MFGKKNGRGKTAALSAWEVGEGYEPIGAIGSEWIEANAYRVPAATYCGKRGTINTKTAKNDEQVRAFWQECGANGTLEALRALALPGARGFFAACTDFKSHAYDYWIAVEVEADADIPDGFERLETRERTCAVFTAKGPAHETVSSMWHAVYNEWFPKGSYIYVPGPEIEHYPFGDREAADYRTEIFVPVKKADGGKEPPKRRDATLGVLFVSVGAVAGMLIAGSSEQPLFAMLVGGALGYFLFDAIDKRKGKTGENGENGENDEKGRRR